MCFHWLTCSRIFLDMYLQHYGLDPAHNCSSSGLLWQAALKMTDQELDLLTDIDQHLFIKEKIREGMAMISHWYALSNAPGMENYDASKRNSYTIYLDASNLYVWAMSQCLPTFSFRWLTQEEMEELDMIMIPESKGYIL